MRKFVPNKYGYLKIAQTYIILDIYKHALIEKLKLFGTNQLTFNFWKYISNING